MTGEDRGALRAEFSRAAAGFGERTLGRFDDLDVLGFAQPSPGGSVLEVGSGTGNFLALFEEMGDLCVGVDLVPEMQREAARLHPGQSLVRAEGIRLPLRSRSVGLVACAQMLHHVAQPVPLVREMARVTAPDGKVLIVDQAAPEKFEHAVVMNELERLRDPTHAASRPPSAFLTIATAAGLRVIDRRVVESRQRLTGWMWAGEFPRERIEQVKRFIELRGSETGMGFEAEGNDWSFTRRRIMLLAVPVNRA